MHQEIIEAVEEIIAPYINQKVKLNVPTLCHFESMLAFTPWDGVAYPFNEKQPIKKQKGSLILTKRHHPQSLLKTLLRVVQNYYGSFSSTKETTLNFKWKNKSHRKRAVVRLLKYIALKMIHVRVHEDQV